LLFESILAAAGLRALLSDRKPYPQPPPKIIKAPPPPPPPRKPKEKIVPISFRPGEPRALNAFNAQNLIIGLLEDAILSRDDHELSIRPQMFAGSAGGGKTLLGKIIAQELRNRNGMTRFIEAMDVNTEEGLDAIMRMVVAHPGSVVFFDEIHTLMGYKHTIKLYLALEENRYHFQGDMQPTKLPPTTFLSATTDYGALPEPFKRRWIIHFFEPYTKSQLEAIVRNRGISISPAARRLIIDRTYFGGAPWEPLQVLELAHNASRARKDKKVRRKDVERVLRLHQIDEFGLRELDRRAIAALFRLIKRKVNGEFHYAGSEENVALMARIDRAEFRATVRPKLLARGLMEIRPWWGHTLTDRAIAMYGHLKEDV